MRFRQTLLATERDRRRMERTVELATGEEQRAVGPRQLRAALDSSPLWGAGRVEDAYTLLGHALRKAVGVLARQPGRAGAPANTCSPETRRELAAVAMELGADLVRHGRKRKRLLVDGDTRPSRTIWTGR